MWRAGGLYRVWALVPHGYQTGKTSHWPGRHRKRTATATGKFPCLLYRRHQWEHTALRTGGGSKQGSHRFLAAYTPRHHGNSQNSQKRTGRSVTKNAHPHSCYPCLSSSSGDRAGREIRRTAVFTIICKMCS